MNEAIDILDTMIIELEARKEPHDGIGSNYSEIQDKIELLREGITRIEKAIGETIKGTQLCGEIYCKYNNKLCQCTISKGLKGEYKGMDEVEETGNKELIDRAWEGCKDSFECDLEFMKKHGIINLILKKEVIL